MLISTATRLRTSESNPSLWPVSLSYGQVNLRPLSTRDEAAWSEIRQRSSQWLGPWDSTRPENSLEQQQSFRQLVKNFQRRARKGLLLPWAVYYAPDVGEKAVFCGQVTVSGISHGSACWGTIGYWIDQRWAGRGIIPLAVALATDFCFQKLSLHRIEVAIVPQNEKSLAVVRKLGFRHEARLSRYMHVGGQWRDHDLFAIHAEDVPEGLVKRLERRQQE
ncbi:MAG: GNAT family N-acetyltransferase [Propionibacteriaceae bacterium]|nr:GNAT family N-acetyltransferase [Propionibacteriaceae bacterium]